MRSTLHRDPPPAPARGRRVSHAQRRAMIEEAARSVFAEYGYHAAPTEEVAARAGISKATLYDHFPSKQAMHVSLLEQQRDELLAHVAERLTGVGTARERIAEALDAFFSYVQDHPYAWQMLFRETTGDPEVGEIHRKIQAEAHQAVVDLILQDPEVHKALGPLTSTDREVLGAVIGGATHGAARWWWHNPKVTRAQLVRTVMRLLWDGLAPDSDQRPDGP